MNNNLPGIGATDDTIWVNPEQAAIYIAKRPLTAGPIPQDPRLPDDHPDQKFTDCRDIDGWTDTIYRMMMAAWGFTKNDDSFKFGQSYGLLPNDPKDMKGAIIVYDILSMVPGMRGKNTREMKPMLREVVPTATTVSIPAQGNFSGDRIVSVKQDPSSTGSTWVWAQRLDAVVRFMVYGDTWDRAIDYTKRTFDLIQTYTGIFKQAGLQNLFFRQQGQDVLHDPPRVQEFPNQCLLYDVTIERQWRTTYAEIQKVLVGAKVINPQGLLGTIEITAQAEGAISSPILPGPSAQ